MNERPITYCWRSDLTDDELDHLYAHAFGHSPAGHEWSSQLRSHSLGWVTARSDEALCGFVNVAWDGSSHAFLIDLIVDPERQMQGLGQQLVRHAVERARAAGCRWLHVDFEQELDHFYLDRCGFTSTKAGLIALA